MLIRNSDREILGVVVGEWEAFGTGWLKMVSLGENLRMRRTPGMEIMRLGKSSGKRKLRDPGNKGSQATGGSV